MSETKPQLPDALRLPSISLGAHSYEHQRPSGLMSDQVAHSWFAKLNRQYAGVPLAEIELTNGIITRSVIIDYALLDFLANHNRVVVADLGAGFSTRRYRLKPQVQQWIHVDLPDVLSARYHLQELVAAAEWGAARDLCKVTAKDIYFSQSAEFTTNYVFIAEGLLNHLPRTCALGLLRLLHEVYPGASLIGTVITETGLHGAQSLGAEMGLSSVAMWSVENTDELRQILEPSRLERVWYLGKVASRIGLMRPARSDEASGFVFRATL